MSPLWPSDAIWQHKSRSTLAQVMAYHLTAPSNNLNQCWHLISMVLWHLNESNFTGCARATILYNNFENDTFWLIATFPRGQWVKMHPKGKCSVTINSVVMRWDCTQYHLVQCIGNKFINHGSPVAFLHASIMLVIAECNRLSSIFNDPWPKKGCIFGCCIISR